MEQKKIDRINELAKLAKERELTDEEKVERAALRQEYVNSVLGDLRNQLNNTYVMDERATRPSSPGGARTVSWASRSDVFRARGRVC